MLQFCRTIFRVASLIKIITPDSKCILDIGTAKQFVSVELRLYSYPSV